MGARCQPAPGGSYSLFNTWLLAIKLAWIDGAEQGVLVLWCSWCSSWKNRLSGRVPVPKSGASGTRQHYGAWPLAGKCPESSSVQVWAVHPP